MPFINVLLRKEYIDHGFRELTDDYNRCHQIKVNLVEGPGSVDERRKIHERDFASGKNSFDIIYLEPSWIPSFVERGYLCSLNTLMPRTFLEQFRKNELKPYIWRKKYWAVPLENDAGILFYRKDLLVQAGEKPPETWEDLVRISKKLQNPPDLWGYTWQGAEYEGLTAHFLELLWGIGGQWINDQGYLDISLFKKTEKVLKFWKRCIYNEHITPKSVLTFKEFESGIHFLEGHAVFHRNWPALYQWSLKDFSKVKEKIGVCPIIHHPGYQSYSTQGGLGFGISAKSNNKCDAASYISFCSLKKNKLFLNKNLGIMPAGRVKSYKASIFKDILKKARLRPQLMEYAKYSMILQKNIYSHLCGNISCGQAVERIIAGTKKAETL